MFMKPRCRNFRINGTFTYMQITYAAGTDAPPYHHRGRFLHILLVTVWFVFLIFAPYNPTSVFPKNKLKYGLV